MSQLNIYRASAGSGKTYRLTIEYLKLLFKNPENYRNILAVTFTNKATEEMKGRIVKEINNLAKGNESAYIDVLKDEFGISEEEIQKRAVDILNRLLHDYSRFSVGTIDSFFQRVLRSFTKEIGLQVGFNIELDTTKVLNEVIDKLFIDIDGKNSLTKWLLDFAQSKIEEGKNWNFKEDITQLGREVFKEEFKSFDTKLIKKLEDKDFLNNYFSDLKEVKSNFENTLKEIGDKALDIIKDHSLSIEDFSNKEKGVVGYFKKLSDKKGFDPGKRAIDALGNPANWYAKTSDRISDIEDAYHNGLNDLLGKALKHYDENFLVYNSTDKVLGFIYTLGILTDISSKIKEYTSENNIFLLSDAANLLKDIIADNDTPFIYEKVGFTYNYFMIDEFQDTSILQWKNFKPLINNSLAESYNSLVVGDVKQSIYRWRSSDWKLLSEQIEDDFKHFDVNAETLKFNWRSKKNVVSFNNTFFQYASLMLQEQFNNSISDNSEVKNSLSDLKEKIVNAYSGLYQHLPKEKKHNGYINASFIENDEKDWKESVKLRLPKIVEELQDKNYKLKDIVFLVRGKKDGKEIADLFLDYKNSDQAKEGYRYEVISNESLFIKNASSVRLIICILKYFDNPSDDINKASIVNEYNVYLRNSDPGEENYHDIFRSVRSGNFFDKLPDGFVKEIDNLKRLPFFELVERIISLFSLNEIKTEIPYLQAFEDVVLEFTKNQTPDIHSFIKWWNEDGVNSTVTTSEQQDAMQIMTIHKSKGLEFKVVMVPFCNWEIDHKINQTNILWCRPEVEPFNALELLPVKYSSKLADTIFYKEYFTEKMQAYVDNLNLLYVAFTRAEDVLYTFSPLPDKIEEMKTVSDLAYTLFKSSRNYAIDRSDSAHEFLEVNKYWDQEKNCFIIGQLEGVDKKEKAVNANDIGMEEYTSNMISKQLRLKQKSRDFFSIEETPVKEKINYGNLMHELFENIISIDDIARSVKRFVFEGKISQAEGEELETRVKELLNKDFVKDWFSDEWKVKNETSILLKGGESRRPDRVLIKDHKAVVIDYKFGEIEKNVYKSQVKEYINYITEMGYKEVEGYVWYVNLDKVERVD